MLSASEIILFLTIIAVTFFFHQWPKMSHSITRLRLRFDKGIAEEYIEAIPDDGGSSDDESEKES